MSIGHGMYSVTESVLKSFCDKYMSLSQELVYWDNDYMSFINNTEERTLVDFLTGKNTRFASESDIRLYFMQLRVQKIAEVIETNKGAQGLQKELTRFLASHGIERDTLKLSHNSGKTLTPVQIYFNHYCIEERLNALNAVMDAKASRR